MILTTYNSSQTQRLGEKLGGILPAGSLIALVGEMGAGKTCLAQGIIMGLGVLDTYITSPSYTLINEYCGRYPIFHFDLYRLSCLQDVEELAYEEYFFGQGVTIIEWADKVKELLPQHYMEITLHKIEETARLVELIPRGENYQELVHQISHVNLVT